MTDAVSRKKKFGLREIASAAQVSISTVSRVLNGSHTVDAAIRKSVLAAAADLDVDFSQRNKTKALALLLSNRVKHHAFHSSVILGSEAICASHNWELIFQSLNYPAHVPGKDLHLPNVVQRRDIVRGVILAGTNSANLLELLASKFVSFVVFRDILMYDVQHSSDHGVLHE